MMAKNTEQAAEKESLFSKEQIIASDRYAGRRDLLDALLDEGKTYSVAAVDVMIDKFMKGKVKK